MQSGTGKVHGAQDEPGTKSQQIISFVERAREGDRVAFGYLVSLFYEDIFRMAYFRTHSEIDAEDLAQDIFIQAFKGLKRLKKADRFRSWLFSIAVNRVRDFQRRRQLFSFFGIHGEHGAIKMEADEERDEPEPLREVMKRDFWDQVGTFLERLSRLEREVFIMRFMDQLTLKEIAETLGKGESTVKTHLYRALKKFKKEAGILRLIGGWPERCLKGT